MPDYRTCTRAADVNGGVFYVSKPPTPVSAPFIAEARTLDESLVERDCLHAITRGAVSSVDIHHPPWPLRRAETDIRLTRAFDGAIGGPAPFHYAAQLGAANWAPYS